MKALYYIAYNHQFVDWVDVESMQIKQTWAIEDVASIKLIAKD